MVYFNLGPITVKASSMFKLGEGEQSTTEQSDTARTSGCLNLCGHKLCPITAHVYLSLTKGLVSKKRRNSCCVYKWQLLWPEDKHSYTYASLGNSSGFICILLPVSFWHSWLHKSQTEIFYYRMCAPVKNSHSLFSFGMKLSMAAPAHHVNLTVTTMLQVQQSLERSVWDQNSMSASTFGVGHNKDRFNACQ